MNNKKYKIPDEDKNTLFERTNTKIWLYANYFIIFFIFLSILVVFLDSIPELNENYLVTFFIIDFIISSIFLIEYIYRWLRSWKKMKFPFKILNIFDLLSFLPFFILVLIYWVGTYSIFVVFRIFRVFRIFELIKRINIIKNLLKSINKHKIEYLSWILVITIILIISSTIVYFAEQKWWNIGTFNTLPNTLRWAIVTMSTTGYWDMLPVTTIWKIVASFLMLLWPVVIAIISSITVIIFLETSKIVQFTKINNVCVNCSSKNRDTAYYCSNCWEKLEKK